jgi:ubiquinone/menaquinone biosynthesis C-methylase UbiE
MGIYSEQFLPRFTDVALGRSVDPTRARVASRLSGDVLELGFGSGRNLPHAPRDVQRFLAVEPALLCRKLAAQRVADAPFPVEWIGLDGRDIPLEDNSVDNALVTWALCTIPDVEQALLETRRVLRPGGTLHFVEHGRSPNPQVAKWQDRLNPLWGRLFGGCHLNRPVADLIEQAGLAIDEMKTYKMGGPEVVGFAYEGTASKPT